MWLDSLVFSGEESGKSNFLRTFAAMENKYIEGKILEKLYVVEVEII